MDPARESELRERAFIARGLGVCPACGRPMTAPGYGSGSNEDGIFCSLECFSNYWYGPSEAITRRAP